MEKINSCLISKSWYLKEEMHEDWEVRKTVIERWKNFKGVGVKNNIILKEIIKHLPKLFNQNYEIPIFLINGTWYSITRFNFNSYPKSIKIMQNTLSMPEKTRYLSRVVKIVFD